MEQRLKHRTRIDNLPPQPTPFIGRDNEIAEIRALLDDPACRLLTLIGPGGVGKTRLAIQIAGQIQDEFADGVYFVPLQPIESVDFLVPAVADGLSFTLRGQEDPELQLFTYLSDKEMLLLLDNFEQLLEGGTAILTTILEVAPAVRLLVTSREVLNLHEEWLYSVRGLSFPAASPASPSGDVADIDPEAYSAVQLFVERARRLRRDFSLAEEQADVIRICQLVEGAPLAIELAASWTRTVPCAVIAAEIERSLDFLESTLRNVPERHRSMRAAFDYSWNLLAEQEQEVFERLSVFRGSFQRAAAERIARATLSVLSALVDKSLLRLEPNGRYQIHELLRQYAGEHLLQSTDDVGYIYDLHCAYFANFLYERQKDLCGGRQIEAAAEIQADLENIRAAWQWAVAGDKVEEIYKSCHALSWLWQFQSRYREAADALERAIHSLQRAKATETTQKTLAGLLVNYGFFCMRLGRLEEGQAMFEQAQAIYIALKIPLPPGNATDPLIGLGIMALIRGNHNEAVRFGVESRQASEAHNHTGNLPYAFYILAQSALLQGDYDIARQHAQTACALVEESDDQWFMAYCLNELGRIAAAQGDYAEARQHYRTSYAIREKFDDHEGMAVALNHLGKVALLEKAYAEAKELHRQSQAYYQEIKDRGGLATSLNGLGAVALARKDYETARRHFRQALQIAQDIQYISLELSILMSVAELLLQTGPQKRGLELAAFVHRHPAGDYETRKRAEQCLSRHQAEFSPDAFDNLIQQGQNGDLKTITAGLQTELAVLQEQLAPQPGAGQESMAGGGEPQPEQPLVDPLTPRELEVLHLIAQGMTNQQMAEELILSTGTVKWYTSQIYSKLNVSSRTQAVARARELNMLA